MDKIYEKHPYLNKKFPILFHLDLQKRKSFSHIHWHENIEILFFEKGKGEVFIDEHIVKAEAGDIVVINSEEMHSTRTTTDNNVIYLCLIIDKNFCEQVGFPVEEQHICNLIKDREIFEKINAIKNELNYKNEFYMPAVMAKIIEILTEFYRKYPFKNTKIKENKNIEMVKKSIGYIKKHINEQISVGDIAVYTGYSKYHFCRCFKEVTGMTVNSYITGIKIDYAKEILENKKISVSEVSEMCGFSDISYFTKIFKKYTGMLPSKV